MKALSIRAKIVVWLVATLLAVIVVRSVFIYTLTRRGLVEALDASLDDWADILANVTRTDGQKVSVELPQQVRARFGASEHRLRFVIHDAATLRLIAGSPNTPEHRFPVEISEIQRKLDAAEDRDAGLTDTVVDPTDGREVRVHAARRQGTLMSSLATSLPIAEQTKVTPPDVIVVVAQDLAGIEGALQALVASMAVSVPFIIAFGVLSGRFAAKRIVDPIGRIAAAAARIRLEDPNDHVTKPGTRDELDSLSDTLNATFDRLRATFDNERRFTADASHELRTPIAIIKSQAEVALRRPREPQEYRDTLVDILSAIRRIEGVTEALLALARADAQTLTEDLTDVDIAPVAEEAAAVHRPTATEKQLRLVVTAQGITHVLGRREQLGIVISNLIANAVRYSERPGTVNVRVSRSNEHVVVEVSDEGIGIAPEQLPRIFDRFFRVDDDRGRDHGGAGLGLSLVKAIVTNHGGTVGASSAIGSGTTIRVTLPATPSARS